MYTQTHSSYSNHILHQTWQLEDWAPKYKSKLNKRTTEQHLVGLDSTRVYSWMATDHLVLTMLFVRMDEWTIKTPIPKCRHNWYFCLVWCKNFVGSESMVRNTEFKLLQNMVYNTTQHPPTFTLRMGGGGGGEVREKVEGHSSQEGSKIPTWLTVSPVYKLY